MKVLLVSNFCTHFLVKPFEELARRLDIRFVFFSDGKEGYWETANKLHSGEFKHVYLDGFELAPKLRVTPGLVRELATTDADAIVMSLTGRIALPLTYMFARLRRKPFILWTGLWYHPDSTFHRLSWPFTRWIYRHSDAVLAYGEHVARFLVKHGTPPERIFLFWQSVDTARLGRAVDPDKRAALRAAWSPDDAPVILYVGRLDPVKSLDTLVDAYARLRADVPCQLVIIGRGPERAALERRAGKLGVTVKFVDYVPNDELPEYYAAADVFCLPSRSLPTVKEAWGLVLNEAMLQRCVPVASDAVGAAVGGLFPDELASLVFVERNVDDLVRILRHALEMSRDPALRDRIREKAMRFDPATQAQGLVDAVAALARR